MDEHGLHPRLTDLLRTQGWTGLTEAQSSALGPLASGRHVLLVAPTGHGKTEAALLPVLSRMLDERDRLEASKKAWPKGFKALYVTPLRALNRDLLGRLESWAQALGLTIGLRHGDTTTSERSRQSRNPPDLLITTPETVQLLLYGDTLRRHLRTVRFVVLDEVHDMCQSERGAQLLVALERIEEVVGQPADLAERKAGDRPCPDRTMARPGGGFQRIGLSATVADPDVVAAWLVGRDRDVEVVRVASQKRVALHVALPVVGPDDKAAAADLSVPPNVVAEVRAVQHLIDAHERVLVFHNTREGAERMASRSALLDDDEHRPQHLGLHHGSLSAEHRQDVEDRFKAGVLKALVATSSLELGIDVGAIDHVVQVHSPRSVARMLQRLGRAGHRVGALSAGTLLAVGAEDALECMAVAAMARDGRLEDLDVRRDPLVVLANQLVAMANEYADLDQDWCWRVITRAGAFEDLDEGLFIATWDVLLDLKTLYTAEHAPSRIGRSGRARRHFLDHIGLIPDERTYRVVDESTKRSIGTVDDAFVAAGLHPGASFVMAGRNWRVLEVEAEQERVRVAPAKELGPVPDWTGNQLPVSRAVAQEAAHLRGVLAVGPVKAPADLDVDAAAWEAAAGPVRDQVAAGLRVPTDTLVTVEADRHGTVVNVPLGTRGNEALGRITQALLHQRLGTAVGMQSDAYRIHFTLPAGSDLDLASMWSALDPDTLDLLVAMVLRGSPLLRHHLVHVAKHFGALPKDLDPNRFSKAKLDALLQHPALHEETMARLVHDRLDLEAVAGFVRGLQDGSVQVAVQAMAPISRLGQDEARRILGGGPTSDALLAAVRERIESSDVMMVCTNCQHRWDLQVHLVPRRPHCRRCQSNQIACLRPWNEDQVPLLRKPRPSKEERLEVQRIRRNAALVASFGDLACTVLVGRGVGPDTAARILQKTTDRNDPHFWKAILQAELDFARTNAYWGR